MLEYESVFLVKTIYQIHYQVSDWCKKEEGWKRREVTLHSQVQTLTQV